MKLPTLIPTGAIAIMLALGKQAFHPASAQANAAPIQGAVRVLDTWQYREGDLLYQTSVPSLATVIGPNTLLTHNHYRSGLGTHPNETLHITDEAGRDVRVAAGRIDLHVVDARTQVLVLPGELAPAAVPVASPQVVAAIGPGDRLAVVFWDDPASRLAQAEFEVIEVAQGVATLADPALRINGGDSGGGAYLEGELVGNTWALIADQDGRPLGRFNVALLPAATADCAPGCQPSCHPELHCQRFGSLP